MSSNAPDNTPQAPVPWWARYITSLIGLVTVIVAVLFIRPALGPEESWVWVSLVIGGATAAGVGQSLLPRGGGERGNVRLSLLVALAAIGAAAAGAYLLSGCASSEQHLKTFEVKLGPAKNRPYPACSFKVIHDGEVDTFGEGDYCPAAPVCQETPL